MYLDLLVGGFFSKKSTGSLSQKAWESKAPRSTTQSLPFPILQAAVCVRLCRSLQRAWGDGDLDRPVAIWIPRFGKWNNEQTKNS